ncbi:MAG: S-methyl-5-thioribose-1-phosphate isomerase [Myxococcaceae bacterium]
MRDLNSLGLKTEGGRVLVLDQTRLPDVEEWLDGTAPAVMAEHIRRLSVRGAPLIGVSAALSLAAHAERGASRAELDQADSALRTARPTAVNLSWALDQLRGVLAAGGGVRELVMKAESIFDQDLQFCEQMANHGAALIAHGEGILTHCNTGGLVTAGIGTALGVIHRAHQQGKDVHVWVDETRPLLQGARLTAWELGRLGIPHTLITDSMAATVLAQGKVQRVLVGADRIAANGDFANKVGTYALAIVARHHGVPFHPVAPWSSVDLACASGRDIPIEERPAPEVRGYREVRWAPSNVRVSNPAFDVTPVSLVESLVLDRGVFSRAALARGLAATEPG